MASQISTAKNGRRRHSRGLVHLGATNLSAGVHAELTPQLACPHGLQFLFSREPGVINRGNSLLFIGSGPMNLGEFMRG
jgi:hypothetical protein